MLLHGSPLFSGRICDFTPLWLITQLFSPSPLKALSPAPTEAVCDPHAEPPSAQRHAAETAAIAARRCRIRLMATEASSMLLSMVARFCAGRA